MHYPKPNRDVLGYLVTRGIDEPYYILYPNADGVTWDRLEYAEDGEKRESFLTTPAAISFFLAATDMAYKVTPVLDQKYFTERKKKFYEAKGISICTTI